MTHESYGARLLRQYAETHPENVVWSAESGWTDEADKEN